MLYTILQKNGGKDTKAMGQTEPQCQTGKKSRQRKCRKSASDSEKNCAPS